jgi:hypothetical protein
MMGKTGSKKRNSLCSENECNRMYGTMILISSDCGPLAEISHMKKGSIIPQIAGIPA